MAIYQPHGCTPLVGKVTQHDQNPMASCKEFINGIQVLGVWPLGPWDVAVQASKEGLQEQSVTHQKLGTCKNRGSPPKQKLKLKKTKTNIWLSFWFQAKHQAGKGGSLYRKGW